MEKKGADGEGGFGWTRYDAGEKMETCSRERFNTREWNKNAKLRISVIWFYIQLYFNVCCLKFVFTFAFSLLPVLFILCFHSLSLPSDTERAKRNFHLSPSVSAALSNHLASFPLSARESSKKKLHTPLAGIWPSCTASLQSHNIEHVSPQRCYVAISS